MEIIQILLFGLTAFIFFISSTTFTALKQPTPGLVLGVLELASAFLSSAGWAELLRVSGKTDWFLLGIIGYPAIALLFISMYVVGMLCIVWSAWRLHRLKKTSAPVAQA